MGVQTYGQQSLTNVVFGFLKQLPVKVTRSTVNNALLNHPDYPSLLSISDVLKQWNVEALAIKTDKQRLHELPVPFIANVNHQQTAFITVANVTDTHVEYKSSRGGVNAQQLDSFLTGWTGVALLAEPGEQAGEKNYRQKRRAEMVQSLKLPLAGALLIALAFYAIFYQAQLPGFSNVYPALLTLKMAGVVITSLLLWYEVDRANPMLKQICGMGKQTNCNAIFGSKQAKLFNTISWSEIGFFYFAGGFAALLLAGTQAAPTLQILVWLNLLALPYTIFSVFYQWRVAKQWCPLCLGVQALLVAEFVSALLISPYFNISSFSFIIQNSSFIIFLSFLLPIVAWYLIKPLLLQAEEAKRKNRELLRFKYDSRIFNALLNKQKQVRVQPHGLGITIGNPNATNTIIKVCNPYCGPCAKAHPEIDQLLEANTDVKVQILFTATADDADKRSKPVKHLLAITGKNEPKLTAKALDDWYLPEKKDYDVFAAKYPMNGELKLQDAKVEAMDKWCKQTEIAFTPTFFVNGYQLPEVYTVGDLKYFLSS